MTTATAFPPVLLKLDPDWLQCMDLWQSPEDAKTTADELNADLGWNCSADGLYRYELLAAKDGVGIYRCNWLYEVVKLKPQDSTTFVEVDA
jgi:hypothetical protein